MIPVEAHRERILGAVSALPPVHLSLPDTLGCVLAEDVASKVDLPGFDNSAMDGYAVRRADILTATEATPARIVVDGDIPAGDRRPHRLEAGHAMRIMTGAPVPVGADTIVPVELSDGGARQARLSGVPPEGAHIRRRGEDVRTGDMVLRTGTRLGPRQLAIASAVGVGDVKVVPQPRVVVISTGDELVDPGTVPSFGEVVDSNGLMLTAAVTELGCAAYRVSGVKDDEATVLKTLRSQLLRADAVITTGGVSKGVYDAVKAALRSLGTVQFDEVAMQPGKPQGFGTLGRGDVPVFTLPGNPVSALVSFHVFVAPALRKIAGRPVDEVPPLRARVTEGWRSPAEKVQFARVVVTQVGLEHQARLVGSQGSHILGGLSEANALAVVPAGVSQVEAGDILDCHPLGLIPVTS